MSSSWFGQEGGDLGGIKARDPVRREVVDLRRGQPGEKVGDHAPDGWGQGKAVPGAKSHGQPFEVGDAADEGEIIWGVGLQATQALTHRSWRTGGNTSHAVAQFPR